MSLSGALVLLALAGLPASATEEEMKAAMHQWEQRLAEYEAALSSASSPEARAAVKAPSGNETAAALWRSVSGKTGTRLKVTRPAQVPTTDAGREESRRVPTYEFEQPWAAPAVVWLLSHPAEFASLFKGREQQLADYANLMLDAIEEVHYASPLMAEMCPLLAESPSVRHYGILKKIYEQNTDKNARGAAAMGLSIQLASPLVSGTVGSPQIARSYRLHYLRQALTLSSDQQRFGSVSLTEAAADQAYILRHLSVGSIPPPLKLESLTGQQATFPARDKVSLLFFWAPGENVGSRIMAKQEAITRQYPALAFFPVTMKPQDVDLFRADLEQLGVKETWTDDEAGSAAQAYRVRQLPLAVLVDENCRIRYIGFPDMKLQAAMDSCLSRSGSSGSSGRAVVLPETADGASAEGEPEVILQPGSQPTPTTAPDENAESPNAEPTTGAAGPTQASADGTPAAEASSPDAGNPATDAAPSDEAPPLREMPEF